MALKVLRKNWQFRLVYREGEKVVCKYSVAFIRRLEQTDGYPAFGFVASKRVGNAVERNRAKRLLREAAHEISGDLSPLDFWVVLVAKSTILNSTYSEIISDLRNNLARSRYLKF